MDNLITLILICAGLSLALNVFLKRFGVESLIGYILTGMIVGFGFHLQQSPALQTIAEFGVAFLMFTIGLEFSPEKLRLMKREVFLYGSGQLLLTSVLFFALGEWLFQAERSINLIVSLALSLSSTAIVLNLLTRSRKINRSYGRNAVGVLLFQDIAVIPILLMVSILAGGQQGLGSLLLDTALDALVVVLLLFLGGRFLTPHVMGQVIGTRSNELFVTGVLLFVVGSAQLAHVLDFSYSLGAFLAGMVIAETPYKHQVEADLTPFRDLLLGVFFISVGIQLDPLFLVSHLPQILTAMALILSIKGLVLLALLRLFNGTRTALKTALLLAQTGEFSFVIFAMAQQNGLFLNPERGQVLIMAVVLTMMLTPFIFRYLDQLIDWLLPTVEEVPDNSVEVDRVAADTPFVLICGYGALGKEVASQLTEMTVPFVAVEHDGHTYRSAREADEPVVFGDAARVQLLEKLLVGQASAVIIAMSNERRAILVAQAVNTVAPDLPVFVYAASEQHRQLLRDIGAIGAVDGLKHSASVLVDHFVAHMDAQHQADEKTTDRRI
ncbi:cation:proton antiporter [Marinobacterium arenosum]|uniref:cation:proton antiporter n=1 Tax=Marinobacterium arenosum TaxID=2862496 RepID=UPI001C96B067|nr:cation:proton antiporter [Marinobacterium arenosum]MBY4676052.1 cation:proton antiporter [Marinobacterium arenosum]